MSVIFWRYCYRLLTRRTLPIMALFTLLSTSALTCNAQPPGSDEAASSSHSEHQPIRLQAQDEPLGELAARLAATSGIDIVVSDSMVAMPVSALIEAASWQAVLARVFADYSTAVKTDTHGRWQRLYLLSTGSGAERSANDSVSSAGRQVSGFPGLSDAGNEHASATGSAQPGVEAGVAEAWRQAEPEPYAGAHRQRNEPEGLTFAEALKARRGELSDDMNDGAIPHDSGKGLAELLNSGAPQRSGEPSVAQQEFIEKLKAATQAAQVDGTAQRAPPLALEDLLQRAQQQQRAGD